VLFLDRVLTSYCYLSPMVAMTSFQVCLLHAAAA